MLTKDKKEFLKTTFEKKYELKKNSDHSLSNDISFDEFLEKIEKPLHDKNKFQFIKPYIKWIVERYVSNKIRYFEDIHSKTIPALFTYDSLKRKNKLKLEHKDINKIKSLNELMDIVDEYKEEDTKSRKEQEKEIEKEFYASGEAVLLYNDSEIKVVIPKTEKASCFFGRNTRWCTTTTRGRNMFLDYAKKGDLYIVLIKKNNERYQFHFETEQFMDEKDEPIDIIELGEKYPKLYDIFDPIAKRKGSIIFKKNLSKKEQLEAVNNNPFIIWYFKNTSEEVKLAAVKKNGCVIEYIKNPSEDVQLAAVKQNNFEYGFAIEHIENPSEKIQLIAVNQNGYAIRYIKNPSEKVQLAAVNKNSYAIEHIENPSEKVQLAAVNQNDLSIFSIKNPSEKVQLAAVKRNPSLIGSLIAWIGNTSEAVQLAAVKKDGLVIRDIKNPSEKVQLAAVKQNPEAIKYIKNPTPKVLELVSLV